MGDARSAKPGPGSDPAAERKAEERALDPVDEASIQSFPASDPPSWSPTSAGAPDHGAAPDEGPPNPSKG